MGKKRIILIVSIVIIAAIASILLFHFLYKVPHDQAIVRFNDAVEGYNTAVHSLKERNQSFDDCIASLRSTINADNIPLDETLLAEADTVLEDAQNVTKDSAPEIPEMPSKTDDINTTSSAITELTTEIGAMGNYSDTIAKLTETQSMYETLIQQFQGAESEVLWVGIDEENTVLRFVVEISNPNTYALTNVATQWTAFDKNDAIILSYENRNPNIPVGKSIYYVGGAGSANLSGTPAHVEVTLSNEGLLTEKVTPNISVSNVQIVDNGYNFFTVTADCITDTEINAIDLTGVIIIKDAGGQIIDADFWSAYNLPEILPENGKFILSGDFFDLSTIPASAEIYVYHVPAV